jgi:cytochrome c-type biogenesis protein CcmH
MIDRDSEATGARAGTSRPARIMLIVAAVVAVGSIGLAVRRAPRGALPAQPPEAAEAAASAEGAGALVDAVAQLEARMKTNPGDAKGWRMLGQGYYQLQRYADAVTAYRRATAAEPDNAEGWSALGEAIMATANGDIPPESAAALRRALAIDPADARARYFLAVEKDVAGDHRGAIADWIALLKDTPAGAPWADNVRQTITQAAQKYGVDVSGRLPATTPPTAAGGAGPRGPSGDQVAAAAALPPEQQAEMIRGMVDGLATRLRANPRDGDGWIRLIRARMVLGDGQAAAGAYRDATAAFADDEKERNRIAEAARDLKVPGL